MSDDSDPAVDQAVDCALTRTVEAQETFVREPAPEKADIVQRRAEDLELLAVEDAETLKRLTADR